MRERARKTALALLTAGALFSAMAAPAVAEPQPPPPKCSNDAQVTPQLRAQVCVSFRAYPGALAWTGKATITNTSGAAVTVTARVDLVDGADEHYGDAVAQTLQPGQQMIPWTTWQLACQCRPGTRARARIDAGGLTQFIVSPSYV